MRRTVLLLLAHASCVGGVFAGRIPCDKWLGPGCRYSGHYDADTDLGKARTRILQGCRWRRRAHQATGRRGTPRPLHYSRGPRESVLVRRRRVVYRGGCRAGPRGARSGRSAGYFTTGNDGILLPRSTESTLYLAGLLRPTTKTTASDGTTGRRRLGRRLRAGPEDDDGLGTETLAEVGPAE